MRKGGMIRKTGTLLLLGGMGFLPTTSAIAADGACCVPGPISNNCQACDDIFSQNASDLSAQLQELTRQCCTPECGTAAECGTVAECDAPADEDCCNGRIMRLFDDCCGNNWLDRAGFSLNGWIDQGITFSDSQNQLAPLGFASKPNEYQMNQLYFQLSKDAATDDGSFGIGMQMDLLIGTDAKTTTANGWDSGWLGHDQKGPDDYGMAMPQLYASFYAPIGNGLTVNVGHFYTIIGYEVVTAPDNFFYSHALTMQHGEPFTHTGFLASYDVNDNIAVTGGMTTGWDDFENENESWGFLGGVTWTSDSEATSVAFAIATGDENDVRGGGLESNRTMFSIVATQKLTDKMTYVIQHDNGIQDNAVVNGTDSKWYGINQYLFYDVTDDLKAGMRVEYWRDADGYRLGVDNANYYNVTGGLNWNLTDCLLLRPELRWDWSDEDNTFDGGTGDSQVTFGTDLIFRF